MTLDNTEITLHCPKCKHQFGEQFGRLKDSPKIPCPACGVTIAVNGSELAATQKAVDDKMDALRSVIKRINKR
jgi:uncharacterized Zn finger protein (UPF0148 family)